VSDLVKYLADKMILSQTTAERWKELENLHGHGAFKMRFWQHEIVYKAEDVDNKLKSIMEIVEELRNHIVCYDGVAHEKIEIIKELLK